MTSKPPNDPAPTAAEMQMLAVENSPGRDALSYRVRTHAGFKAEMVAHLAGSSALRSLAHAQADDPTLALIDAWAATLDVLTFYQERIANEGYLRTATERRSLQELGRTVGYELNPGIAAETYLAFTLEEGPSAPEKVVIGAGTKVQTVPGPGEEAQVFETINEIVGRPEWNVLHPVLNRWCPPGKGDTHTYLKGVNTGLRPGDGILFVGSARKNNPESDDWDFRHVKKVEPEAANDRTKVIWDRELEQATDIQEVHALRTRVALFGHNAPDWKSMPDSIKNAYLGQGSTAAVDNSVTEWPGYSITNVCSGYGLLGKYYDYNPNRANGDLVFGEEKHRRVDETINFDWGSGSPAPLISEDFMVYWEGWIRPTCSSTYEFFTISDDGVRLYLGEAPDGESTKLIIDDLSFHAEELRKSNPLRLEAGRCYKIILKYFDSGGAAVVRLLWARTDQPDKPLQVIPARVLFPSKPAWPDSIQLDAIYPQIRPGDDSWLILSTPQHAELYQVESATEDARTDFTLSSKTTRVALKGKNLDRFDSKLRDTVVFAQSEELNIADATILDDVNKDQATIPLPEKVIGLEQGRVLILSGIETKTNDLVTEPVMLEQISDDGFSLTLRTPLQHNYNRESLKIFANVARATHGDTRKEVLGSANANQSHQQFALRQGPLTFTPAPTATGGQSTLKVRVNDILWDEVPTLNGLTPRDRVFTAHEGPDGKMIVQFGDGQSGARPPSGDENISATYRVGLGTAGNVKTDQLRVLLTRPLGVRGVSNPQPSAGGADREDVADARQNAPRTVLTLDRIVSLRDYEDFARAFGSVAKARADWLRDGTRGIVYVSVVGAHGSKMDEDSLKRLRLAVNDARDPAQNVRVETTAAKLFKIAVRLVVSRGYRDEVVLEDARAALCLAFGLKGRDFGQDVTESDVLGLLQLVNGVEAANFEKPFPNGRLTAALAQWEGGDIKPAELLMLDESSDAVSLRVARDLTEPELKGEPT
jgi:hypothetical protein